MHIWCCNIKNYYIKHSQNKKYDRFQIDGQAFTSSYINMNLNGRYKKKNFKEEPDMPPQIGVKIERSSLFLDKLHYLVFLCCHILPMPSGITLKYLHC